MSKKVTLELELKPIEEETEHDLGYFMEELKEFFEQFGWKVTWNSYEA